MIDIQICYDPFTVIPSDSDYVEDQLTEFKDKINFIYIFDEDELSADIPTILVSNTGIFKAEITDREKLIAETSHLDLVAPSVESIKGLIDERK